MNLKQLKKEVETKLGNHLALSGVPIAKYQYEMLNAIIDNMRLSARNTLFFYPREAGKATVKKILKSKV